MCSSLKTYRRTERRDRMYFVDLLAMTDKEKYIQEFVNYAEKTFLEDLALGLSKANSFHKDAVMDGIRQTVAYLETLTPRYSNRYTIHIVQESWDNQTPFDSAYVKDENDSSTYCFDSAPWEEILGFRVNEDELAKYTQEYYVVLVLWELTFYGYDEETVQKNKNQTTDESEIQSLLSNPNFSDVFKNMAEKGYKEYKDKSNNSVFELETDIGKIIYEIDELTKNVTIKSIEM